MPQPEIVRRIKSYSSESGYVYQYQFQDVHPATRDGAAGNEFVYYVSADRKTMFPVRNTEFTQVLASVLHRPAIFPAPAFALRLALGEMADALLLSSQRVEPAQLSANRYAFRFENLEPALHAILAKV